MIVGVKKNLGFSLHTQDPVAFADTTLPICEEALKTFSLTPRRAPPLRRVLICTL